MGGFLGAKEDLTRERVKEIFRNKQYSYLEQKVTLLDQRDDSLLLKISFLLEYKGRMISIEEKEPIAVDFKLGNFNQASGNETRGHRFLAPGAITAASFADYQSKLRARS